MDETYAQSLIDWMDGEGGYREWYAANHGTVLKGGPQTNDSGDHGPPPPPPPPGDGNPGA